MSCQPNSVVTVPDPERTQVVTIADPESTSVVIQEGEYVVVIGAGQGPPGPSGTVAGVPTYELSVVLTLPGAQTVSLPNIKAAAGVDLFVNGVRQPRSEFSATNTMLTLPAGLNLMAGDTVTVVYQS